MQLEFGVHTFGDVTVGSDGQPRSHAQVLRDVIAEGILADQLGIDFFAVGEHHREDFAITAPEIVLAAVAGQTSRIHLGTAVTVLSSDDPIRVFERFATLDALSNGRAEVILGRGSFTESFPLFGYSMEDYEILFSEKLDLFAAVLEQDRTRRGFSWRGTTRSPLANQSVFPRTESGKLKTWIGVGGTPESVVRAARYNMRLMLAIIGGHPQRFRPYVDLFHREREGRGLPRLEVGVHSMGYVAETDTAAREESWPAYSEMRDRIGSERGWPPISKAEFVQEIERGSLYIGSSETVAQKIAATARSLELSRFDLKYSMGKLRPSQMLRTIELYGKEVVPRVRELLSSPA